MNYQWYPGHMTKARRQMLEDVGLIDLIIEIVDARIPLSSRNPDIDEIGKNKFRLVLLNKADLADPAVNKEWIRYFADKGIKTIEINSKSGQGVKQIGSMVKEVCRDKIERDRKRGIKNRPIRAMVVGIPNVGKSTFINAFAGKACAKTGNKPGVTKGQQWIKLSKELELLDTPGILWPKFEDNDTGMKLAFIGSINDEILVIEELALDFVKYLEGIYPGIIKEYYKLEGEMHTDHRALEEVAKARKCLSSGGEPDILKASRLIIDDYRSGRLGRLSLERPEGKE